MIVGEPDPVTSGAASDVAAARSRAEAALGAHSTDEASN